ncbi:Exopolyphosphatase [Hoeflea phototrophica DFL-43]|uniref:Exopolyphosphatase n=1 Tax=Hoeflea phototrophica (strain DSM 17068 / NCIMB 14078 / DFL-43) TaxID=411684 RepID=A9D068_HOEPD|nr:Ppx/GppA phosphatase family protein [Hoeflea phototrophica]EDQ34938.2 Exopolyphosphatase [Hoeflea phototrophica DFL-43]
MKDLRDGDKPNAGVSLAGESPSGRAQKAATEGVEQGRGETATSGSKPGVSPSGGASAGESAETSKHAAPGRRRRRRRRKTAAKAAVVATPAQADGGSVTEVPAPKTAASAPESGKPSTGKSRRRRRKPGRAIQGRPLARQTAPGQPEDASPVGKPVQVQAGERSLGNGAAHAAAQPRRQYDDLYAALDLGTNNCRLLVAQPTRPGQFRVVDAFSRIVRLGEGLDATGELSAGAMDRAVEALKICASKLKSRPVRRQRLIATEACRSARNGTEFLERVERETGLQLEIVTRETEARLAVAGCSSLVERDTDGLVLFDIGGGSSEIAMIDLTENRSNRLANHIKAWTSLPVGVVTLSERHGGCMVTREVFEAMVAEVDDLLSAFVAPPLPAFSGLGDDRMHLLGTSGTVTTLAGLHLELPRYDRRKVDGLWLSNSEVDRMLDMLLSWDFDARAANPCIGADRADLVLAGCAILQSIRKRWPSQRMRVADRGLREGLLNEMMAADGAWRGRGRNFRNRKQRPHPGAKS